MVSGLIYSDSLKANSSEISEREIRSYVDKVVLKNISSPGGHSEHESLRREICSEEFIEKQSA